MKNSGRRWAILFTGMLLGAAVMGTVSSYHVVQSAEGMAWVPRTATGWSHAFVDVREWQAEHWRQHPHLLQAIARSSHRDLLPPEVSQFPRRGRFARHGPGAKPTVIRYQ